MKLSKAARRNRIHKRIRRRVSGTPSCPRISVFRSNKEIYVQIVDDTKGHTLLAASSRELAEKPENRVEQSKAVGKLLAEKAASAGINKVIFDRSGYLYHGRVKALAEGAREGGLNF